MTQIVSETRERFIRAIAEQVAADRIAEIHFFNPIKQGGLESGVISPDTTFNCGGTGTFFGRRFRCVARNGHGIVDVERGLKVSCDIFFYNTGARMGIDKIAEYAKDFGLGSITQIDLDGEKAGIVPSTEWAAAKQHRKWYPSETISVSIGQGPLIVTPMQVAVMMAAIANGGTIYRPHVVRAIEHVHVDRRRAVKVQQDRRRTVTDEVIEAALLQLQTVEIDSILTDEIWDSLDEAEAEVNSGNGRSAEEVNAKMKELFPG